MASLFNIVGATNLRNVIIIALIGILAFVLWRLGDVERERYALTVGMCRDKSAVSPDASCLETVEPRKNRLWDIFYGLAK